MFKELFSDYWLQMLFIVFRKAIIEYRTGLNLLFCHFTLPRDILQVLFSQFSGIIQWIFVSVFLII